MKRLLQAYPLWIADPMFSIWSPSDELNGGDTMFWTRKTRKTFGLVRWHGRVYSFMGKLSGTDALMQESVSVTAYTTDYEFSCPEFRLKVSFVSPLTPDDLEILSCPVCYTEYEVCPVGRLAPDFSVALSLDEEFCYNDARAQVVGGVIPRKGYEAAFFTRERNLILSDTGDSTAPDWGDIYLAGEESWFVSDTGLNVYLGTGKAEYLRKGGERLHLLSVGKSEKGFFMLGFDDKVSVFYFGEWLKGYYFRDGKTIVDALAYAFDSEEKIVCKCRSFDKKLRTDCDAVGEGYYRLACAALRQTMGGHKLVQNGKGELLFLSKECDSNGCIGTVDVSYPSMPLYLLYNAELVNAMLRGQR